MSKKINLSILDFGYRNSNHIDAINSIIDYAIEAENLKFKRIWFAEHHNKLQIQTYLNPEIIIPLIAGNTDTIRVGSGGCLIGYHSVYDIASNYKFLNNIYSNRIDLGLAKGRPGNYDFHDFFKENDKDHSIRVLKNIENIIDVYKREKFYLDNNNILLPPYGGIPPQLWYFSNTYNNLDFCLEKKLNFCRSLIHGTNMLNHHANIDILNRYEEEYFFKYKKKPTIALAIAVSFSLSESDIERYEILNKDNPERLTIIPVNEKKFIELTGYIQSYYGIDEIIVLDIEDDDSRRLENLYKMSKAIIL